MMNILNQPPASTWLQHHVILTTMGLLVIVLASANINATEFSDDFESTNVSTVATFTLSDNGIVATVEGGTAFTIGNAALYHSGTKSWMVEPAGSNARGTHDGSGTITFSEPMSRIGFWVRSEFSGVSSTVSLLDVDGNFAENAPITTVTSDQWTQVNFTIADGAPALQSVLFEVAGTGMAALDDLSATTMDTGGDTTPPPTTTPPTTTPTSSGGGGGGLYWPLLILLGFLITLRKNRG